MKTSEPSTNQQQTTGTKGEFIDFFMIPTF
ncbi:hypothetical protein AsAng_0027580 [Aureispira anguillae]|uniref:Uncharacterized protein n=1 Tax=Aureispira anguillae TaxID=2864201 RepID=A0A915YF90_9BACT|nr:hypothetical protein AsAng_0027580 [Aureispira anguillae]